MYGALVKNNSGQILISSEAESLHFAGYGQYVTTTLTGMTNFPNFAGDDGTQTLSGRHIHQYTVYTSAQPLVFIKPLSTGLDNFYGILQLYQPEPGSNYWRLIVIQSGPTSTPPDIFVFTTPGTIAAPTESFGFATYTADGKKAFDSRLKPLAIYAAASLVTPMYPCDGGIPGHSGERDYDWKDQTLDFNFKCDTTFNFASMPTTADRSNLMFSAPSTAQAVYSRIKRGYKLSSDVYISQQHWSTAFWWAMYHSAYRIRAGVMDAGWCIYDAGYQYSENFEGGGWFGGSGGGSAYGFAPYDDKTINLSPNLMIVADSGLYV